MSPFKFDYENQNQNVFFDGAKANSVTRQNNIETLKNNGFEDCGVYSSSGALRVGTFNKKPCITFGKRSNIGSKQCKYFTLVKTFETIEERNGDFVALTEKMSVA